MSSADANGFMTESIQRLADVCEDKGYSECKLDVLEMVARFIDGASDNPDKASVLKLLWYSINGLERD